MKKLKLLWGEIQTFVKVNAEADFRVNGKDIMFRSIGRSSNTDLNTLYWQQKLTYFKFQSVIVNQSCIILSIIWRKYTNNMIMWPDWNKNMIHY